MLNRMHHAHLEVHSVAVPTESKALSVSYPRSPTGKPHSVYVCPVSIGLMACAMLVALVVTAIANAISQYSLNANLIDASKRHDLRLAQSALCDGADPNCHAEDS